MIHYTALLFLGLDGVRIHPGPPEGNVPDDYCQMCALQEVTPGMGPTLTHPEMPLPVPMAMLFDLAREQLDNRVNVLEIYVEAKEKGRWEIKGVKKPTGGPEIAEA